MTDARRFEQAFLDMKDEYVASTYQCTLVGLVVGGLPWVMILCRDVLGWQGEATVAAAFMPFAIGAFCANRASARIREKWSRVTSQGLTTP